ncbi:MAG: OmpA family protein, partial [Ferruginibacter sp.]|nr:OmpA family protein [Ferruginibacter sp.]
LADAVNNENIAVRTVVKGDINEDGNFVYTVGDAKEIDLPNDAKISLAAGSDLYRMHEKIKANDNALLEKTNWFTLEDLYFEKGSDKLKASSEKTLKNLYEMVNCYNLNIKLGGYTDNSGDSLQNVKLSAQRAEAAKAALVKMGLAADRIEAEGYGPMHPKCDADLSMACMAQNRRIDVRITKK